MDQTDIVNSATASSKWSHHDPVSMAIHWSTLVILVMVFGSIWAREYASDGETASALLTLHRSAGTLIWIVTLARIVWKVTAAPAPAFPSDMPRAQRWIARANEYALYVLLAAQPITGFVQSIARGKEFTVFGLAVPSVMVRDQALTHAFHDLHETGASVLLVLVGLHFCAALFHGLILRDGVLGTMFPKRKSLFRFRPSV